MNAGGDRPAAIDPALSEFAAKPTALIVHDPVAAGAFAAFRSADEGRLEKDWLFRERPDEARYSAQHRAFVDALRRSVGEVHHLVDLVEDPESLEGLSRNPNHVFTRDSLITIPWIPEGYIPARMREPLRRPETRALEAAVRRLGLRELVRLPDALFLEGGDVVPLTLGGRRMLLVGYGPRTAVEALAFLRDELVPAHVDEVVGVELAPWRLNLDGGLLPVAEDVVVADTGSIVGGVRLDAGGRRAVDVLGMLRDLGMRVIETTREESVLAQSCNGVCLGDRRIVTYDLCPRVSAALRRHGVEPIPVAGSELVKGRGGPRCMTRPIYASRPRRQDRPRGAGSVDRAGEGSHAAPRGRATPRATRG